ncbi:hypothetical protein ACFL9T_18595 [Thermodesulfobacteriota bacterium]
MPGSALKDKSRGSHFRSDFPHEDDDNWLRNIVISKENDGMMLESVPVRLDVTPHQNIK